VIVGRNPTVTYRFIIPINSGKVQSRQGIENCTQNGAQTGQDPNGFEGQTSQIHQQ